MINSTCFCSDSYLCTASTPYRRSGPRAQPKDLWRVVTGNKPCMRPALITGVPGWCAVLAAR